MARHSDAELVAHLLELMQVVGPVSARRMFGGHGLFIDGLMFALVADATLYFKVDCQTRDGYLEQGLAPFTYQRSGKTFALNYCQAPDQVYEEQELMRVWGSAAFEVALRAAAAKRH